MSLHLRPSLYSEQGLPSMDCQATLYFDMVASNSYLSVSCIIAQRDEQGKKILKTPLVF